VTVASGVGSKTGADCSQDASKKVIGKIHKNRLSIMRKKQPKLQISTNVLYPICEYNGYLIKSYVEATR
jgi:hypothetical protein